MHTTASTKRCKAAEAEVDNKELELQKLRAEKEKLRSENLKLKQAVSTRGEHQEILQNQLTAKEEELLLAKNKNDVQETVAEHTHSSTKIEELLNSKLDQAVQNLKESVFKQTNNKQINDKLNQVLTQNRISLQDSIIRRNNWKYFVYTGSGSPFYNGKSKKSAISRRER